MVDTIPPEFFDALNSPLFWVILVIALVLSSLVPAFLLRVAMSLMFREQVSFGFILMAYVVQGVLFMLALGYFGAPMVALLAAPVWWVQVLIAVAWLFLSAVMFDLLAPNAEGDNVASWKWALGMIGAWALSIVLTVLLVFGVVLFLQAANISGV